MSNITPWSLFRDTVSDQPVTAHNRFLEPADFRVLVDTVGQMKKANPQLLLSLSEGLNLIFKYVDVRWGHQEMATLFEKLGAHWHTGTQTIQDFANGMDAYIKEMKTPVFAPVTPPVVLLSPEHRTCANCHRPLQLPMLQWREQVRMCHHCKYVTIYAVPDWHINPQTRQSEPGRTTVLQELSLAPNPTANTTHQAAALTDKQIKELKKALKNEREREREQPMKVAVEPRP